MVNDASLQLVDQWIQLPSPRKIWGTKQRFPGTKTGITWYNWLQPIESAWHILAHLYNWSSANPTSNSIQLPSTFLGTSYINLFSNGSDRAIINRILFIIHYHQPAFVDDTSYQPMFDSNDTNHQSPTYCRLKFRNFLKKMVAAPRLL